jgi:hypothetical protein
MKATNHTISHEKEEMQENFKRLGPFTFLRITVVRTAGSSVYEEVHQASFSQSLLQKLKD